MGDDVLIRGGLVVDGTGAPGHVGDVAVRDDLIVAVGAPGEIDDAVSPGAERIDAAGCWVTPGLIDPHTHLDAQLCWDPSGSPSNRHGVTTVVMGLCGFGVAPCPDGGGEYLLRSLEVVEEIPYGSTSLGVPFGWNSWRQFRDHIARQDLGVNAAGFVPHSALRYFAMGDRARTDPATPADIAAMVAELRDALEAGAVGFATSRGPNHVDGFHEPVPSRLADDAEMAALVGACAGRVWQINVETKFSHDATALTTEVDRYAAWTEAAGARLTWTPFYAEPGETVWRDVLDHNRGLNGRGIRVSPQITTVPITLMLRFDERSFLTGVTGWQDALKGFFRLSREERIARLDDPAVRSVMKEGGGDPKNPLTPDFDLWTFTYTPTRPDLAGRTLADAAATDDADPVDLLCDQAIRDDLATLVDVPILNRSRDGVVRFLEDSHTLLGLGDAGAHVMTVTNYRYPTFLLAELVQRRAVVPLELAINRMTQVPARLHGLSGRGELRAGAIADICVIDPDRLRLGDVAIRHDLPGAAPRLDQPGHGFRAVIVNGVRTIVDDEPTGAAPGRMLSAD